MGLTLPFEKLPPICNEQGQPQLMPMGSLIAVGFGSAYVTRDNHVIYAESDVNDEAYWNCQKAESIAKDDPDHDYRIHKVGPLHEGHYQRQGIGEWILYSEGPGFA